MAKITEDTKNIWGKCRTFIFATASKTGKPNGVPIGMAKIISDEEIMLTDNFMKKTRQNIAENPQVAVSFWSPDDHYGYQFKGKARVETSGKNYEDVKKSMQERKMPFSPKAVVIIKVEEIYYVGGGAGKDSGVRLDQLPQS